jgi:hypothetical protein
MAKWLSTFYVKKHRVLQKFNGHSKFQIKLIIRFNWLIFDNTCNMIKNTKFELSNRKFDQA